MKRAVLLLGLLSLTACATSTQPADLVLTGGRVYTGVPSQPWAEAVAIRGNTIAAVGTSVELAPMARNATRVIDLAGRLVVPGINDAHVHEPNAKENVVVLEPADASTRDAFLEAIRNAVARVPPGVTVVAPLPLHLVDSGLSRADLDAISTSSPIRVATFGGHSAVLNSAALRAWGIADDAADPAGGSYGRRDGKLDGWLYEHAYWMPQFRAAASADVDELRASMRSFEAEALRYGITSVQTMALLPAGLIDSALADTEPRLRWRVIEFRMAPYAPGSGNAVKYILDGTPMERSMATRTAYADAPSARGMMNYSRAEIESMVKDAANGERQLLVHASGDEAIASLLDAMEKTPADWPLLRVRIEHGDMITTELAARARALGVFVVQNPAHFMIPELMAKRFGPERAGRVQMARSLVANGNPFALGSDGPINPFLNMFFAATHPGNPSEALTVEQSLRAYTEGAARAEFAERRKGTIAPGMLADLAVLSQDIFSISPEELPKTVSELTIVGGKIEWEAPAP